MNSNCIVEVLVLIVRSELDINVLSNTRRNHALLVIFDFKVGRGGWQNVKPLWGRRIVNQSHFQCVSLEGLETCKLHH
jgi:hypothetical protein